MKRLLSVMVLVALAGCGGGGGGDGGTAGGSSNPPVSGNPTTYFQQGGLSWSSTSATTYIDVPLGSSLPLNPSARYYCSGKVNGVMDNFNNEDGWRLPTLSELQALYAAMPKPPGFANGRCGQVDQRECLLWISQLATRSLQVTPLQAAST